MTGARIATKPEGVPTTRSDTIGIVMGVKTIVVLIYQLLTSHVQRFHRWASVKAYAILNTLEILFWFVVLILTLMGVSRLCSGVSCGLSWVCILIAVVLCLLAAWTSVVSIKNWRLSKKMGNHDYAGNHDYGHGLPK
ncbi:hypothetical protein V493_00079 [Pseudogymnoascus sp. VKM F-4281 (FW-2241)]|nr:hypothetical protein V493_00079 [Pseudogymnoascus sp. VKM F-4281 (FW-2241)]